MGFRMRKSFKVAPGVRLNVSKRGVGASAGVGPARYSVHSSGRTTKSVRTGIPGISYVESRGGGGRRTTPVPAAPVRPAKPGWFAPKGEKALYKAVQAQDPVAIRAVGDLFADYRCLAYALAGLMLLGSDSGEAARLLDASFAIGDDPASHVFATKYLFMRVELQLAPGISAMLPVDRDAVGLSLAEFRQAEGELSAAIDVVEQLEPSTYAAVSLADLYSAAARWEEVIDLTDNVSNEDDASALLLVYRGAAFRHQGLYDAAHESLKEALRARSRGADIRHLALRERAENYVSQGKKSLARKDLERILADDAATPGVRKRLEELSDSSG